MTVWRVDGDDLLIGIRLTPGAAIDAVGGVWADDMGRHWLSARVRAAPEQSRANAALVALIADRLDWPTRMISLESGAVSRLKRLRIGGAAHVADRLSVAIGNG
ncbi:MAG: DUF167 family protein [Sphingobium sp.]